MSSNNNAAESFGWLELWNRYPVRACRLMRMWRKDWETYGLRGQYAARLYLKERLGRHLLQREDWRELNG